MSQQHPDLSRLVTWTLVPPYNCRFQNDVGSNCILVFERGREEEVAKAVQDQIAYQLMYSKGLVPGQAPPIGPQESADPDMAALLKEIDQRGWTTDENGRLVRKGQ